MIADLMVPESKESLRRYEVTVTKENFERIQEICKEHDCRLIQTACNVYQIVPNWVEEEPEYEVE